jgi:choline transport protein
MDEKTLGSIGDLELSDQAGGASSIPDVRRDVSSMTRDERDMAFYGKKEQLKVRGLVPVMTVSPD